MTPSEIDQRMSAIVRKIVEGTATDSDRHEYQQLVVDRSKRLTRESPAYYEMIERHRAREARMRGRE